MILYLAFSISVSLTYLAYALSFNSIIMDKFSYDDYSKTVHLPKSTGPLALSAMRPPEMHRTWHSQAVESLIQSIKSRIKNKDLARLFENCYPNTVSSPKNRLIPA